MRLASDLVDEIAAARLLALAQQASGGGGNVQAAGTGSAQPAPVPQPMPRPRRGAGAVHPQLGWHLVTMPGDSISGHAYRHLTQPLGPPPGRSAGGGSAQQAGQPGPDPAGTVPQRAGKPRPRGKLPARLEADPVRDGPRAGQRWPDPGHHHQGARQLSPRAGHELLRASLLPGPAGGLQRAVLDALDLRVPGERREARGYGVLPPRRQACLPARPRARQRSLPGAHLRRRSRPAHPVHRRDQPG